MDININDHLPQHKYIRLFNNEEEYNQAIENRELEECNYSVVNKGNLVERLEYQPSTRTTNNDNLKLMNYFSQDDVRLWAGLKIIWGYFGWEEKDFELNGETLKGGQFYKVKPMTVVKTVPDLYQYQHLNNFLLNIDTVTEYEEQDFSTIKSASWLINVPYSTNIIFIPRCYTDLDNLINLEGILINFVSYNTKVEFESDIIFLNNITSINKSIINYNNHNINNKCFINCPKISLSSVTKLYASLLKHECVYLTHHNNSTIEEPIIINKYQSLINLNSIEEVYAIYSINNNLNQYINININEQFHEYLTKDNIQYTRLIYLCKFINANISFNELKEFNIYEPNNNAIFILFDGINKTTSNVLLKNIYIPDLHSKTSSLNQTIYSNKFSLSNTSITIDNVIIIGNDIYINFNNSNIKINYLKIIEKKIKTFDWDISDCLLDIKYFTFRQINHTFNFENCTFDSNDENKIHTFAVSNLSTDIDISFTNCILKENNSILLTEDNTDNVEEDYKLIFLTARFTKSYFSFDKTSSIYKNEMNAIYLFYQSTNSNYIIDEFFYSNRLLNLNFVGVYKKINFNFSKLDNGILTIKSRTNIDINNDDNENLNIIIHNNINNITEEVEDGKIITYLDLNALKYNIFYSNTNNKSSIGVKGSFNIYSDNIKIDSNDTTNMNLIISQYKNINDKGNVTLKCNQVYVDGNPTRQIYIKHIDESANNYYYNFNITLKDYNNITPNDIKFTKDSISRFVKINTINYEDYDYFDISHIVLVTNNNEYITFNINKCKHLKLKHGVFNLNYNDLTDIEDEYLKATCLGNIDFETLYPDEQQPKNYNILTLHRVLYNKFTNTEKEQLLTCWKTINIRENETE